MHKESGGLDRMLKRCISVSMILVIPAMLGKKDGANFRFGRDIHQ